MRDLIVPGLDQEDVGSLLNTRTFPQYCEMVRKILAGECMFCELDPELNKVELENEYWRAWRNPYKQKHTAHHWIIAHRLHLTHLRDLESPLSSGALLFDILVKIASPEYIFGGGVLMRFGDPRYNSGSIRHLHVNFFVPDGTGELRLPLCKKPEDVATKMDIIRVFEKMRTGTPFGSLDSTERDLVRDRLK
jgi:hypothetical protein